MARDDLRQVQLPLSDDESPARRGPAEEPFGLERRFDAAFVARLALREKQVQQSYRPIIGIHKWFARRPGSVFRSLMLAEFGEPPISDSYWQAHDIEAVVADPFMGGGTTVFEALRLGAAVVGCDINPMAYWLVRQAVEPIDLTDFVATGEDVWRRLLEDVGNLYETSCTDCGAAAPVKYFLWVKTCSCPACGEDVRLFPGYLVAEAVRHPRSVHYCPHCEQLREIEPGAAVTCPECERSLESGNVRRGKAACDGCGADFQFADCLDAPPRHHLFGIEYQCPACYPGIKGRQFKTPDSHDRDNVLQAATRLQREKRRFRIPDDAISAGDETDRLLRWGYRRWRDLFGDRQLLGLGILLRHLQQVEDPRIRHALATVFSDFLRYQNLLCRYDTYGLKCQDIFSVHGFPVGLVVCENNVAGIRRVGSGSFIHFVDKFAKAKHYAKEPYETLLGKSRRTILATPGETIEATLVDGEPDGSERAAWLTCAASQDVPLESASLDAVFTDPPYFANVQYAELMDFCYVWLRKLVDGDEPAFAAETTRTQQELTGNETLGRGLEQFTTGLSEVFRRMADALKPGAPLCFTYHHNAASAYAPLVVAILDADLTCTAVLAAPAEMTASLHIAGTKSSILDSVFVCRSASWVAAHDEEGASAPLGTVDERVEADVATMREAGYSCTSGDRACLRAGHLAGDAVRALRHSWDPDLPTEVRLKAVEELMSDVTSTVPLP